MIGIVDPAGDDRAVGIAVEKIDDHFLADARQELRPELSAGPALGDAHPAGVVTPLKGSPSFSPFFAVPRKPHAHPTQTVGENLVRVLLSVPSSADDDTKVRSVGNRLDPAGRERQREQRRLGSRMAVGLIVEPLSGIAAKLE